MGQKIYGYRTGRQTWGIASSNVTHDVGVITTDDTEYGLLVRDIPLDVVASNTETLSAGGAPATYINWASSQSCRNISMSCPSGFYLFNSGQNYGCKYQANVVYDIPISNTNKIWISGTGSLPVSFYWTAFG